ncbi:hypothetical protein Hanom_Chr17g01539981 [Helianthus anomalus]
MMFGSHMVIFRFKLQGASRLGRTLDVYGLVWFESRVRLRIISNSGQIWSCLGSGQQRVRVMVWFNSGLNSGHNWSRGILFNRLMGFGSSQFSMVQVWSKRVNSVNTRVNSGQQAVNC